MNSVHRGRHELQVWLELRLDESWVGAYRIVPAHDGQPEIGEVRLVPYSETAGLGEFDAVAHPGARPPWTALRQLQGDGALRAVQEVLEYLHDRDGPYVELNLERFGFATTGDAVRPRRRSRTPDSELARVAQVSADADSAPRKAVAETMCCSTSNASKLRRRARDRGYLAADETLTPAGRVAGELAHSTMVEPPASERQARELAAVSRRQP